MANTMKPVFCQLDKKIQALLDAGFDFYAKVDKDGKVLVLTSECFDRRKHKKAKEDHKKGNP